MCFLIFSFVFVWLVFVKNVTESPLLLLTSPWNSWQTIWAYILSRGCHVVLLYLSRFLSSSDDAVLEHSPALSSLFVLFVGWFLVLFCLFIFYFLSLRVLYENNLADMIEFLFWIWLFMVWNTFLTAIRMAHPSL